MEGNLGTCSPTRTGSAKTAVSASRGHNPITGVITSEVFNPTVLGENDWLPFIRLNWPSLWLPSFETNQQAQWVQDTITTTTKHQKVFSWTPISAVIQKLNKNWTVCTLYIHCMADTWYHSGYHAAVVDWALKKSHYASIQLFICEWRGYLLTILQDTIMSKTFYSQISLEISYLFNTYCRKRNTNYIFYI